MPGDRYTRFSYNQAVKRACRRANVSPWCPNQLRHLRATEVRKQHGIEAAQVMLGHARADVTEVYAEKNLEKAIEIARESG